MDDIRFYEGGIGVDDRGCVTFVNTFDFSNVKRFYMVENFDPSTIRAFHGHKNEGKYVFVSKGSAIVAAVPMDDTESPSRSNPVTRVILSDRKPTVMYIPPGYANGFRAIEEGTKIIFFSSSTLEESKGDDYRFPADYWGSDIWEVEDR